MNNIFTLLCLPVEFRRLMFKRETLSMMNCHHIKVVNLYQLPFKRSWKGCRNALRGFQLVLSLFSYNSFGKKILSTRPKFCDNLGGPSSSVCWELLIQKKKQKSLIQSRGFCSGWSVEMSTLEHALYSNSQQISSRFKVVLEKWM